MIVCWFSISVVHFMFRYSNLWIEFFDAAKDFLY